MSETDGDRAFTAESLYGTRWESAYAGAQSFLRRTYTRELAGVTDYPGMIHNGL